MIEKDGIRAAQLLELRHLKNMDKRLPADVRVFMTEAEVVAAVRRCFGVLRSELLSVNGNARAIDWASFQMFSRTDEAVLGYPKIGIGISFEYSKIEIGKREGVS